MSVVGRGGDAADNTGANGTVPLVHMAAAGGWFGEIWGMGVEGSREGTAGLRRRNCGASGADHATVDPLSIDVYDRHGGGGGEGGGGRSLGASRKEKKAVTEMEGGDRGRKHVQGEIVRVGCGIRERRVPGEFEWAIILGRWKRAYVTSIWRGGEGAM